MKYSNSFIPVLGCAAITLIASIITSHAVAPTLRLVPIGDSITQGRGGATPVYSWRYPLWQTMIDVGAQVDFVGSLKIGFTSDPNWADYKGVPFDKDHEGHWGWRTDGIRDQLTGWLAGYTPDIAMIMLGTNDWGPDNTLGLSATQSATKTKGEMLEIITKLRADNPYIIILLGDPFQEWTPFPDYRTAYRSLAEEESTEDSPIYNVPQASGWVSDPNKADTDTVDWVHPNQKGDRKVADNFYLALYPYLVTNFTGWQRYYFASDPTAANADSLADPDHDGLNNLMEYALNTNPLLNDASTQGPQLVVDGNNLHYTFARDPDLPNISYEVQSSEDLSNWVSEYDSTTTPDNNNGNYHTVTVDTSDRPTLFLRLVIKDTSEN